MIISYKLRIKFPRKHFWNAELCRIYCKKACFRKPGQGSLPLCCEIVQESRMLSSGWFPGVCRYLPADEDGTDSVPKRWLLNYRRRWITQKKTYDIQNTAKVWNQNSSGIILIILPSKTKQQDLRADGFIMSAFYKFRPKPKAGRRKTAWASTPILQSLPSDLVQQNLVTY
jgi:hypothetical protein